MSYNGIGLQTPRGSGTNGYVMRNLSHVKRYNDTGTKKMHEFDEKSLTKRKINPEISKHERRRQIESKVLLFREELLAHTESQQARYPEEEVREREKTEEEEEGEKREETIEPLVQEYREKLWKEAEQEDRYHEKNNFESLMHDEDKPSGSRSRDDYFGNERKNQTYTGRLESRRDISPMSTGRSHNRRHRDSYYRGRDRYSEDVERDYEHERNPRYSERSRRKEYDSYSSYRPRRHAHSRSISRSPSPKSRSDTRDERYYRSRRHAHSRSISRSPSPKSRSYTRDERYYRSRRPSFHDRERSPPERGEVQESDSPIE
ncbi:complexed with Cdc5 protein Cwf21 [Schizosaccharomyces octosporus yFS286]|uniref:Complexed with Cdc5 protein Cwf21 n=1 Tax=Schizosaccharomyces octosporus (strain yFS286) TaxID=483514 RepID=S9RG17_SCHOY|nr:complexed with Cdc5 protein Cwf21 [Schizosaccharomyces octosporus yFS286]EPX73014.1 complexed with Cdc5 protein Cwf21 [Schizosaccharomyces octosporus yFS286]